MTGYLIMMTKTKQKLAGMLLALVLSLGVSVTNASAIQFVIDDGNSDVEPDQDFATVDVTISGGTIHVVVTTFPGFGIFGNGAGNGAFGFNVDGSTAVTFANIIPTGGATGCAGGSGGQFDGFGNFELSLECGSASNNITSLSFDLTRVSDPFTSESDIVEENSGGNAFAAHICRRDDGETSCAATGFAAAGGTAGPGPGPGPGPSQEIPEPSTLILLGSGLLLVRAARKFTRPSK